MNDEIIVSWVNETLTAAGKDSTISSFKVQIFVRSLCSGMCYAVCLCVLYTWCECRRMYACTRTLHCHVIEYSV